MMQSISSPSIMDEHTFPARILSTLPTCFHISDEHEPMPTLLLESMPPCLWQD